MVADRETHRERRYKQNDGKRQIETERHRDGGRQRDTERKAVQNLKKLKETEAERERHRDGGRQRDSERKAVQKKRWGDGGRDRKTQKWRQTGRVVETNKKRSRNKKTQMEVQDRKTESLTDGRVK